MMKDKSMEHIEKSKICFFLEFNIGRIENREGEDHSDSLGIFAINLGIS